MEDSEIQQYIENSIEQIKQRHVDNLKFVFLWKEGLGEKENKTIYIGLEDEPDDDYKKGFVSSQVKPSDHKRITFKRNRINEFFSNPEKFEQYYEIISVDEDTTNLIKNFFYMESVHEVVHHLSELNNINLKEDDVIAIAIFLLKNRKLPIQLKQPIM